MTVQFIGGARLLETAAGIPYDTGLPDLRGQHRAVYRPMAAFAPACSTTRCRAW
ncbi:hypothetical protein LNQ52_11925 [Klebsiella pneumoniae subsp. pneumoniae]|nr:hypothetical protein [Klebsiella pneumoniae subsp. pneumoniae]